MHNYIDGFALPLPTAQLDIYKKVVSQVAEIWKEHGALSYKEYVLDDASLEGTCSFLELVNAQADESVIFGWVSFASREARDQANTLVAADPRMEALIAPLTDPSRVIFDAGRMFFGGFKAFV